MGKIEKLESPIKNQMFIWKAVYESGDFLTEFENNKKENNFDDINKDILTRFGLIGCTLDFSYSIDTGVFDLLNNKYAFKIEYDDTSIDLTGAKDHKYNDIITYKKFLCDISIGGKKQAHYHPIPEFYFGYKTIIKNEDITIYYQNLFAIIIGKTIKFCLKLTPSRDVTNGKLVFISQQDGITKFPLNLTKNESSNLEYQMSLQTVPFKN